MSAKCHFVDGLLGLLLNLLIQCKRAAGKANNRSGTATLTPPIIHQGVQLLEQ